MELIDRLPPVSRSVAKSRKQIRALAAIALACALGGCANPGIVQISPNTYLLSKSSAAGAFANTAKLKADVVREANEFAAAQGKVLIPISLNENRPSAGFPSCEYQFMAVTPPEAQRIAAAQTKRKEDQLKDWNSLTPAQRMEYTLRTQELAQRDRAITSAEHRARSAAISGELDRNSYDQRTRAIQQPVNVNVNQSGTVDHNVRGTINVYGY